MPMTTKLVRIVTYRTPLLPIKSYDHIITWSCLITWQIKVIVYPLSQCLWLAKLAGWGFTINSQDPLITWSDKVTWKIKYVIISTITSSMSIKLGKVVCYYKGLPWVKSHNPLNAWSHEVTWEINYVISLLPEDLLSLNVKKWWLTMRGIHP